MDIYEQIKRFDDLQRFVNDELPRFAVRVLANDLAALVTNRVVQKGENYQGASFSPYSKNTVAAWRFWGKSRTQTAEKKIRAISKARGALSYEEFRKLNNLKTDKKNFEFTSEMWRKFGIIKSQIGNGEFFISLGGTTKASQDKIDENSNREGISIIEASESEEATVQRTALKWLEDQTDRILNG